MRLIISREAFFSFMTIQFNEGIYNKCKNSIT